MNDINSVAIVGGGDNGLVAALSLRERFPTADITVIDDPDRPVSDVGKSTTNTFKDILHGYLRIDAGRFVSEVKPVWKMTIFFADWCGLEPFHLPFDETTLQPTVPSKQRFDVLTVRHRDNDFRTLGGELVERGLTPFSNDRGRIEVYEHFAYHLNTKRFNAFLRTLCGERDVEIVGDTIDTVEVSDDRITRIHGETIQYEADLYVDASGFDRVLMEALDNEFVKFDHPLDSAVVTTVDLSLSEVVPATVLRSGEYGWFWQIDTYDCRDLGYVYASEYTSHASAAAEFVECHEGVFTEDEVAHYRFQPGVLERAWVSNCIAVGNALGFVEPLLSTALSVNALLCSNLSKFLADHGGINHPGVRTIYNDWAAAVWNDVYNIDSLSYRCSAGDDGFWSAMKNAGRTEGVSGYLDPYQRNGFCSYDQLQDGPCAYPRYLMYRLIRGMGVRSAFYDRFDVEASLEAEEYVANHGKEVTQRVRNHLSYEEFYRREGGRSG